ncbi:MAG: HepT-like ribonuclease domain-containing protein [Victivallales bacterium]
MKRHEVCKYLYDIHEASGLIEQFVAGKILEEYSADPLLRSGVERQFEIIGEALNQALRVDPDLAQSITDPGLIIAFRNRLIHGYASIADEVVWGVIEKKLPVLHREVEMLLDKTDL